MQVTVVPGCGLRSRVRRFESCRGHPPGFSDIRPLNWPFPNIRPRPSPSRQVIAGSLALSAIDLCGRHHPAHLRRSMSSPQASPLLPLLERVARAWETAGRTGRPQGCISRADTAGTAGDEEADRPGTSHADRVASGYEEAS